MLEFSTMLFKIKLEKWRTIEIEILSNFNKL